MKFAPDSTLSRRLAAAAGALLLTATLAVTPAVAQDQTTGVPAAAAQPDMGGRHHGGDPAKRLEHMTKALKLTMDQQSQIKAIQADSQQQMQTLRADDTTKGADRHAKMASLRDAEQAKVRAVLDDTQKPKFDAMVEKMKEHRQHKKGEETTPPAA